MSRIILVVAALLLPGLTGIAEAAEYPEHQSNLSKNARKALIVLGAVGLNDKDVREFVEQLDTKVERGNFTLAETEFAGGKIALRYAMDKETIMKDRRVELHYQPDDSHWEGTMRTNAALVNYKLKF